MKDAKKDMKLAMSEESTEDVRELCDEELDNIAGGADILERVKPPSNERPPIEAPIFNPFRLGSSRDAR